MKNYIYILLLSIPVCFEYSEKYYIAMDNAISLFNSSETQDDFLIAANQFYRISQVVKTDWLSSYYYAYCNTEISMLQDDSDIKELYLDKAFEILEPFDSLNNQDIDSLALSEIYTLRAMIYVGKIFINPMVNGMKYGPLSGKSIDKAKALYPLNPRPYFLDGQSMFYTPSAFGGGLDKARPLLAEAMELYRKFEAKKHWPDWGMDDCQYLYEKAVNSIE